MAFEQESVESFFERLAPGGALANYPWSRLKPRTIPVAQADVIYAADYGGSWDGTGDDTSALMDAVAAANSGNRTLMLPARVRTTEAIQLTHGTALVGYGNWANTGLHRGTLIDWAGDSDDTIIKCWGREITVEDLSIRCASGFSCNRAIDTTWPDASNLCTACTFRNLFIRGDRMTYGMVFGDTSQGLGAYPANCDYMTFDRVYVDGTGGEMVACIYVPNTTGQCKHYNFFGGSLGTAQYGLSAARCGFRFYGVGFTALTGAAVNMTNTSDTHEFYGCDAENCSRLYTLPGNSGASQSVGIFGGRYDCTTGLNSDGRYILIGNVGPITIHGANFAAPDSGNWAIHDSGSSEPMQVITTGCVFPSVSGGYESLVTGFGARWARFGCSVAPQSGTHFAIPDRSYELNVARWANLPAFAQGSEPSSAAAGALIRNSTTNRPRYYDGSAWDDVVLTGDLP